MKFHIYTPIKDVPWGGGNQFLKGLSAAFSQRSLYTSSIEDADCVLFNSYQEIADMLALRNVFPQKIFLHRLGPIFSLHRGKHYKFLDRLTVNIANNLADGIVIQSQWSLEHLERLGLGKNVPYKLILNAPNTSDFFPSETKENSKIRLIAASWSNNPNKGFAFYQFLDQKLDFSRFEMTFVGNSPVKFSNIKMKPALNSAQLGEELRKSDIMISAIKDDACSNSILEALATNLPILALDSGANRELIQGGGRLFYDELSLMTALEDLCYQYDHYQQAIPNRNFTDVIDEYLDLALSLKVQSHTRTPWYGFKAKTQLQSFRLYDRIHGKLSSLLKNNRV